MLKIIAYNHRQNIGRDTEKKLINHLVIMGYILTFKAERNSKQEKKESEIRPFNIQKFAEYCKEYGHSFQLNGETWEFKHGLLRFKKPVRIAYFETNAGEEAILMFAPNAHIIKNLRNAGSWLSFYEYSVITYISSY